MVTACEADIPLQPSGATLKELPLIACALPTVALLAGMDDEVAKPNWLPRTIHGAGGVGSPAASAAAKLDPLPSPLLAGLVPLGDRPEEGASVITLGAVSVPVLGSIACTSLHWLMTGLEEFFGAPNGIEKEMM